MIPERPATLSRRPVYIAAPHRAAEPGRVHWNMARAAALARLAVSEGLAPIAPSLGGPLIFGPDETEAVRAMALDVGVAILGLVARSTLGLIWILETDAGGLTEGVKLEHATWRRYHPGGGRVARAPGDRRGTWADFGQAFQAAGLGRLHQVLATPPAGREASDAARQVLEALTLARFQVGDGDQATSAAADAMLELVAREFLGASAAPLFKCLSSECPGLSWKASPARPHPCPAMRPRVDHG